MEGGPPNAEIAECFERSQPVIEQTKKTFPVFHSRAMRAAFFKKAGLISINVKPAMLHYFYKDSTGQLFSCMHLEVYFQGFIPLHNDVIILINPAAMLVTHFVL